MPHVQILGSLRLADVGDLAAGLLVAHPPLILKVQEAYLGRRGQQLLLECMVAEGYLRQHFFLLLNQQEQGILIRCHPAVPVQKTSGVKQLIAEIARTCIQKYPAARIGHTNLQPLLGDPPR
jgi:hypothetical protein